MKILLISARYLPHKGGLISVVQHLASEFTRQGHVVRVVANCYPKNLRRQEVIKGVVVDRLHFLLPEKEQLGAGRFDLFFAGLWFKFWTRQQLKRVIQDFKPYVINNHYLNAVADFTGGCLQTINEDIPWVISLHGGDVDGEPLQNEKKRLRFIRVSQQADRLTACSKFPEEPSIALEPSLQSKIY